MTPDPHESSTSNEEAILALCLRDAGVIHEAVSLGLSVDHFHDRGHRALWSGMILDVRRGATPDEAIITDRHSRDVGPTKPWVDFTAMNSTVERLSSARVRRVNAVRYVEAILESARRRVAVSAAQAVLAMAREGVSTDQVVEELQRGSVQAGATTVQQRDLPTLGEIAQQACDRALAISRGEAADNIIPLGLRDLDGKFAARRGDYILVGARPSMGKTHFLLSILQSVAQSGPVLLNSIEMGQQSLGDRIWAHDARGHWSSNPDAASASGRSVMARWGDLPIRVDTRSRSLSQICSSIRVAAQRDGIVAAGIDYLQLMRLPRSGSREQEVATASRELAALASEMDIVLFVLCQLNRNLEQRPIHDRRPRMSDLRESGQLEQDADGILFLFREAAYNPAAEHPEILEVGIAKQRNGRAPRTAFVRYVPGDGYMADLTIGEEMRASDEYRSS